MNFPGQFQLLSDFLNPRSDLHRRSDAIKIHSCAILIVVYNILKNHIFVENFKLKRHRHLKKIERKTLISGGFRKLQFSLDF